MSTTEQDLTLELEASEDNVETDSPTKASTDAVPATDPASAPPSRRSRGRTERRRDRPPVPLPPRQPMPDGVALVVITMALLALVAAWFLLQAFALGGLSQARAQNLLHSDLREQLAAQTVPTGGEIAPGAPIALLQIPTLGVSQVVVEGTAPGDLLAGPGHRRDTVLPGQAGIAVVYGRSASYGAPFRTLSSLRTGDGLAVTTAQGEFVYRVDGVRREGDPLPAALAPGGGRLTLVTAEGEGLLAPVAPDRTVYVDATLVGEAAIAPPGRPSTVPEAEKAFASDTSVVPLLALCLQVLLLAAVGTVMALRRLPAQVVWVLAAPVLVAAAWLTVDVAVQLLPNLL